MNNVSGICIIKTLIIEIHILAKDIEDLFNDDYKKCKEVSSKCSKLEDAALEYMINCYTSSFSVKSILKTLIQINNAVINIRKSISSVINETRGMSARQNVVSCGKYISDVTEINNVSKTFLSCN